ncbi:amine oxidase [Halococcus hamelinensis 100A6]|uniref:Amine oxidase n=2 Tax=Halococcus hamelinensis TaxID=332168 RepID=M0M0D5_9EURY|nr:amine oxidase [Halococcus hamelinensis 100A6]
MQTDESKHATTGFEYASGFAPRTTNRFMNVIVVGGGLAGLVAARHLAAGGLDVELIERHDTAGGRVRSRIVDGYTLDRGFQVLFTAYPGVRRELDLASLDLRSFTPGATLARPGSTRPLADPRRDPRSLPATAAAPDATLGDKLRVVRLWRALADRRESEAFAGPDRSVADYLDERGFSERFVESFFAPFYGGITLDRDLSTSAAVFEYTFRMLAAGDIAVPVNGMGAVTAQLADGARAAGAQLTLGTTVESVEPTDDDATVELGTETREADAVVVATDPPTARDLTGVESIPTDARGCVTQYLSYPSDQRLPTGGKLLLNAAGDEPNHVAPLSNVAPEYAPSGRDLLSATFLGTRDESDDALANRVRRALASWYPDRRFDLSPVATDRIEFAQFAQPPGFYRGLPAADAPEGPVFLAGDYTNWSSIHGAIGSGRTAARTVLDSA